MAKPVRKKDQKRRVQKTEQMPLGRDNFMILGTGLGVILAGYLAMLTGGVEGFLPLVVSPILLILGYCVIIPLGILYRKREAGTSAEPAVPGA